MIKRILLVCLALLAGAAAARDEETDEQAVARALREKYPNTAIRAVRRIPIDGLYEVTMGSNTAYTDATARYFVFGHLFDMKEQVDLTAKRQAEQQKTQFPAQFLKNAIKSVKGDGSRVVAVFSDPDCPYCRRLETELAKLDNVTIYTFLFPLETLHPEAKTKAISVWCAPDREAAWKQAVFTGTVPKLAACENPVNDNLVLGSRLGVVGTPTLIAQDGRLLPGAVSAERLNAWLDAATPRAAQTADGARK